MGSGNSKAKSHPRRPTDNSALIRVKENSNLQQNKININAKSKNDVEKQPPSETKHGSINADPERPTNIPAIFPVSPSKPPEPEQNDKKEGEDKQKQVHGSRRPSRVLRPKSAPRRVDRQKISIRVDRQKTSIRPKMAARPGSRSGLRMTPSQKDSQHSAILHGDMTVECPSTVKVVRVFTSSTFTDTEHERNALMERVYPRLREKCQQLGYEFQVVDMRWGVRDEATDDHMTTDLCLREVDLCMKLSTGPCFVTFLSHKYGYRPLPNRIESEEFELVLSGVDSDADTQLINRWYREDENAVPPTYVLQPISSHLPDYISELSDKRQVAVDQWYQDSDRMKMILEDAAQKILEPAVAHNYVMSVTEKEITHALFTHDKKAGRSAWFDRKIEGIDTLNNTNDTSLQRFKDLKGSEKQNEEARDLLCELRNNKLPVYIPDKCHMKYSVHWEKQGIDPASVRDHKRYIDELCMDVENTLMGMIKYGIKSRPSTSNQVLQEAIQHVTFCQQKCSSFHGRQSVLKSINKYIISNTNTPFIVHGVSGSGKTSVVAMAAKQAWTSLKGETAVVLRFIGTTPDSSSICNLLRSITSQIWAIYGHEGNDLPTSLNDLVPVFHEALALADDRKPLVVVLDSLDQLDSSDNGRLLSWMPRSLPQDVKLIVSTLPDGQYDCLQKLQALYPSRGLFIQIPKLPDEDAGGILDKWLEAASRKLTVFQRQTIQNAYRQCPLPLYLKLAFDEACKWRSYTPPDRTVLENSVRGCIQELFFRLERNHGRLFVSRALGYLTLSRSGLTESELEDILSCDDDVLNDVYTYWTPPIRRLPPLLLVRLRTDIDQYVVDRGADGVAVSFWYHRQFIEAAQERYCSDDNLRLQMHAALADFFSGIWAHGKEKPYTNKNNESLRADRHVSAQPLKFDDAYNLRLLNNLPFHRLRAHQLTELKQECLCNFPFLQAKLNAVGLRAVLEDFHQGRALFEDDGDLSTIGEALQLSQGALTKHTSELPSQLFGRIQDTQGLGTFLLQCRGASQGHLVASQPILTRPGGQLVHCLAGHKAEITGLAITCDGEYAVTCSNDRSLKIWDVNTGKLHHSVEGIGEDPDTIRLCCNDRLALVNPDGSVQAYELVTGNRKYSVDVEIMKAQFCVAGKGDTTLGVFIPPRSIRLYRASDGKFVTEVDCPFARSDAAIGDFGPSHGCGNYMVNVDSEQRYLFVFDLSALQFKPTYEAFPVQETQQLNTKEDFLSIDAVALIDDGVKVVLSTMYNSDLHVLKTANMELLHVIKGVDRDMSEKFHVTPDSRYLYFASQSYVVAWELRTQERAAILEQSTTYRDVVTADMEVLVTVGEEHVLKIWDLSREESSDPHSLQQHNEGFAISHCVTLDNPRYVVVFGVANNSARFFKVHDLVTCTDVRKIQVNADIQDMISLDTYRVLVRIGRKLKIVDCKDMAVTVTFQGKLPLGSYKDFRVINKGKEVVAVSRGRHNVKVYTTSTGKVKRIIESDDDKRIICILVSKNNTTMVVEKEDGSYVIGDLNLGSFLYKFDPLTLNFKDTYTEDACVTDDGRYFIFGGERYDDEDDDDSPPHRIFVWNIKDRLLERELTDHETYEKFLQTGDAYYDTAVDHFSLLSSTSILANLHDGKMRVFDLTTGEARHTLEGHSSSSSRVEEWSPYLVTRGTWTEDQTLRVINRHTMQAVASYTPDFTLSDLRITHDGHHMVGFFPNYPSPVTWSLKGTGDNILPHKPLSSFGKTYGDRVRSAGVALMTSQDEEDDPNDLDTDTDETETDMIVADDFEDCLSDDDSDRSGKFSKYSF